MKLIKFVGLVLASAVVVAAPARGQGSKSGVIPQGLADGPYVHTMAMHHEEGIKMADLGATKAANPDVKALAARILANRQKELSELKQFMTSVAEDMAPADRNTLKKMPLETLEKASDAAFDRMFLDMMIEHHRDAIAMTRSAKLVMPSVQQFARRTTQQQTAEIKEMEALRKVGWIDIPQR